MTGSGPTVLVVDDGAEIRQVVGALLRREGFAVVAAADGLAGIALARRVGPDVIVLDLGLPGEDGIDVCRRLRAFSDAYVLMLTSRDTELDKVAGLTAGADDYMTKPFSGPELVARVRALLRRPRRTAEPVGAAAAPLAVGALTVDLAARDVRVHGEPVPLTRTELDLLGVLADAAGSVVPRERLLEAVWGADWFGSPHVVDVHVSNLRRKLRAAGAPGAVVTVRGVGHRLTAAATTEGA